jgi:PAS domain S-box-containing protein
VAAAIWLVLSRWVGGNYTFGVFSLAVAAACWYGTIRAGLYATAFSTLLIGAFFPEQGPLIVANASTQIIWFLATSLVICLVLASSERTAREADEARSTLNSLVEVAPIGILLLDADRRFVLVNQALAEMNGIPASAHIGKRIDEILPHVACRIDDLYRRIMETGEPLPSFETTGESPAEPRNWTESWFPVRDADGVTIGVGAMIQEVTQARRNELALRDADRRKDEFLAMLAHELRNPLAPIRNAVHILRLDDLTPPQAKATYIIDRQVNHLVRLVDDLLDLARITTGKIELRKRNTELVSIINSAVDGVRPLIERKRQALEIFLPRHKVLLNVDGARLSQVVSNLLHNASKFTPEGGHIALDAAEEGEYVVIRVRDDGEGISPELQTRIFDMFEQGPQTPGEGGLGIGLSLARRLVEMHSGTITVRSDGPGKGSEFSLRVPAGVEHRIERRAGHARDPSTMAGLRILLVEDNPDSAESLETLLSMLGNEVRTTYDGANAIIAFEQFRPDVALVDIGLPGMNGHAVAQEIRRMPHGRSALLIALTGWGQQKDHEESRRAGFDGHLLKPLDLGQLSAFLENAKRERDAGAVASG